jgi:hypothetical protein
MNANTRQLVRKGANESPTGTPAYPHYSPTAGHWKLLRPDLMAMILIVCLTVARAVHADDFRPVPLQQSSGGVQPMTGIVMWESSKTST